MSQALSDRRVLGLARPQIQTADRSSVAFESDSLDHRGREGARAGEDATAVNWRGTVCLLVFPYQVPRDTCRIRPRMALSAGTRFGPHEITALLGVGGMGEVYRARDTNLNREVAI